MLGCLGFFNKLLLTQTLHKGMMMKKTGIVKDERYLNHQMGAYHPESPQRLEVIYSMLEEPDMKGCFIDVPVRLAEKEELIMVHAPEYVDRLAGTAGRDYTYLDPDTQTCADSYEAALLAAGGFCEAVSMVCSGDLHNAFALVRPPGHHAESARAMGFCLFNNVAIGARFAQRCMNMERILVVDWDLHHGNGTQHSFEEDDSILYFSTHQYPYYPGSGAYHEMGTGAGRGYTVNVPMSVGHGDGEFVSVFEAILKPIALEFDPQMILVSAGFDIYMGDPLGGMNVTPEGFAGLTRSIMNIADLCCDGKVVITLEGGYSLQGLRDSARDVLRELADISRTDLARIMERASKRAVAEMVGGVKRVHEQYWKGL